MRALVFSIDDTYVMPFQVLFHGLHITGSIPDETPIFIIHQEELSTGSIATLHEFLGKYGRKANFIDADEHIPDDLPLSEGDHVSKATFYRLFVASILPPHVTSALYLDSDTIVTKSIRELFEMELTLPIAAVDHLSPQNELRIWGWQGGNYFQAGVLLIDLESWRENRCSDCFVKIIREQRHKIMLWDQDVLNIAFAGNWQRLEIWFNVCQSVMKLYSAEKISENARLIHFDGSHKPWKAEVVRPFKDAWLDAYALTFAAPYGLPQTQARSPGVVVLLSRAVKSRLKGLIYGA